MNWKHQQKVSIYLGWLVYAFPANSLLNFGLSSCRNLNDLDNNNNQSRLLNLNLSLKYLGCFSSHSFLTMHNVCQKLWCRFRTVESNPGHTNFKCQKPPLFVFNRGDTYYSITAGSRQGSLAKPLSLLFLTPRPALSSHQHRTLVCLFWSGNLHCTVLTHQQIPLLLAKSVLSREFDGFHLNYDYNGQMLFCKLSLTVLSLWGNPEMARCRRKCDLGYWIHPAARSILGKQ